MITREELEKTTQHYDRADLWVLVEKLLSERDAALSDLAQANKSLQEWTMANVGQRETILRLQREIQSLRLTASKKQPAGFKGRGKK